MKRLLKTVVTLALGCALPVYAQSYPAKPIRLIAPFPAGGALDTSARTLAPRLSELLGQQVIVENRAGAGGNIGAELVARSPADGYTLLMGTITTHAISATLFSKLGYDLQKDLAPVSLVVNSPLVLVAHPSLPVKTIKDVIALAHKRPGEIAFASHGTGTLSHLVQELLRSQAKINVVHVPYKGSAPANVDLLGGHVSLLFDSVAPSLGNIRAGRVRAIGVASAKRSNSLPEVPTIAETGLHGFEANNWFAVMAPAGTPKEIISRLNTEIVKAVADLRARFIELGLEPQSSTPEQMRDIIASDIARWAKVIRESGVKVD
jgi:tripartite-type tricarboxylate transporter receptor subunit TctC